MIKTSIIVPVYNTSDYLEECFDSIFGQTQKEIEVIAINDGSTDDSLCVLERIKSKYPEMMIFSQKHEGPGNARNKGIDLAKGEFIYFMDSDDCLVNTAVESCYQCAKENQLDIVIFDAETFGNVRHDDKRYDRSEIINEQEVVLNGEDFAEKYWLKCFIPSACLIYSSTQFIKRNRLRFLQNIYYEDNEFHIKLLSLAKRVMYIPQMLYKRRYRELSITTESFDSRHAKDYLTMIRSIGTHTYSDRIILIVKELQLNFLEFLYKKCIANDLFKDVEIATELYNMILDVCGGSIDTVRRFSGIDMLYQLTNNVLKNIVPEETKRGIERRRKEMAEKIFRCAPLQSEEKYVGIYGTGKNTERFLDGYQKHIGAVKAKIIFINSETSLKQRKFRGYEIFNVNSIASIPLDCIIIASEKYESEMFKTLKEKYGERFKIICLKTDLHF